MKQKPKLTWTKADNARAIREGWTIGKTSEGVQYIALEHMGGPRKFDRDEQALEFVAGRMLAGSKLHAKAMAIVVGAAKVGAKPHTHTKNCPDNGYACPLGNGKPTDNTTPRQWSQAERNTAFIVAPNPDPNITHVVARAESPETAALIVRAVNAHGELIAAALDALDTLDGVGAFATGKLKEIISDSTKKTRAALRAAGEEA